MTKAVHVPFNIYEYELTHTQTHTQQHTHKYIYTLFSPMAMGLSHVIQYYNVTETVVDEMNGRTIKLWFYLFSVFVSMLLFSHIWYIWYIYTNTQRTSEMNCNINVYVV